MSNLNNKRQSPHNNNGAAPTSPYTLNKFKPGKRDHVLDDSVLDDATRRMLMEEISRVPRPRLPPSMPTAGTSTTLDAEGRSGAPSGIGRTSSFSSKPSVAPLSSHAIGGGGTAGGYQSTTLGGSDDLLTIMTQRLKTLENNQRVMQLELKEKSRKVIELEDHLKAEKEARTKATHAKSDLQRELGEILQFMGEHGLTWEGSYEASMRREDDDDYDADQTPERTHHHSSPSSNGTQRHEAADKKKTSKTTDTDDVDGHVAVKQKAPALSLLYEGDFAMPGKGAEPSAATSSAAAAGRSPQPPASNPPSYAGRSNGTTAKAPLVGRELVDTDGAVAFVRLPFDLELLKRNCLILSDHVGSQAFLGEGQKRMLKEREKVFLCIYSDGICVNSGPFRPYGWALCDAFLNDILEGYYPYEFKDRYPDGFPVEVVDRSTVKCPGNGAAKNVHNGGAGASVNGTQPSGSKLSNLTGGHKLGGAANPHAAAAAAVVGKNPIYNGKSSGGGASGSNAQHSSSPLSDIKTLAETEGTYKPMSRDDFLKKLPERYIAAGGRLVNIRAGVEELVPNGAAAASGGHALGSGDGAPTTSSAAAAAGGEGGPQIRSNVPKLLEQAAENKRVDAAIKAARERDEAAAAAVQGPLYTAAGGGGGGAKRPRSLAAGSILLSDAARAGLKALDRPAPTPPHIISAQGEIVGTGGTAPANEAFLQTVKGRTPAAAELLRRQESSDLLAKSGGGGGTVNSANDSIASRRIVTLQVRLPQGHRCVLNMFVTDSIADVRREFEAAVPDFFRGRSQSPQLDHPSHRTGGGISSRRNAYELSSVFPRRICSDHAATLEALGLFPNATLMVRMAFPDE